MIYSKEIKERRERNTRKERKRPQTHIETSMSTPLVLLKRYQ
jgi:hypothetical protein